MKFNCTILQLNVIITFILLLKLAKIWSYGYWWGFRLDIASPVSQDGLKVAIIEKDKMGGTCLNRGFLPSKLLIHSANVDETTKNPDIRHQSKWILCGFSENNAPDKWNYRFWFRWHNVRTTPVWVQSCLQDNANLLERKKFHL